MGLAVHVSGVPLLQATEAPEAAVYLYAWPSVVLSLQDERALPATSLDECSFRLSSPLLAALSISCCMNSSQVIHVMSSVHPFSSPLGNLSFDMPMASPDDPSLVVSVVTLFLLVATVVTVIARTAMRWALTRKTHLDDAIIMIATGLATAQSIVIVAGVVPNGLGQKYHHLSSLQRSLFQKHYYAAVLLYIPCICVSNLAVLFLLQTITPVTWHRRLLVVAGTITVAWGTAAELASAFQCDLPTPWTVLDGATQKGQCFDIVSDRSHCPERPG